MHADREHLEPGGERRGQERRRGEQADEVRLPAVRQLSGRDDREQHEGRADAGAGLGTQRPGARPQSDFHTHLSVQHA